MADSFAFQIDWIIVSAMIGLLVALIGAFVYPRRDHD
jgi:ABC-type Mn2+/Zn2+ transport system permease subunit